MKKDNKNPQVEHNTILKEPRSELNRNHKQQNYKKIIYSFDDSDLDNEARVESVDKIPHHY